MDKETKNITINDKIKEIDKLISELNEIKASFSELEKLDIPYVPSTDERITTMLKLAEPVKRKKMIDLGCGDGRVIIAFAKAGAIATGVELHKKRYDLTIKNINQVHMDKKIAVLNKNLFEINLKKYDLITLYGVDSLMPRLEKKLIKEAHRGTKVISNYFAFPNLRIALSENKINLYVM